MTVYGDLLFLINFSMDFLCFYISCMLLHRRLPLLRTCAASALGGVYSVLALFLTADETVALILDLLCCFVMCFAVFFGIKTRLWKVIKASALYFFVSMLMGGVMTALFSLFNRTELFSGEMDTGEGITVWIFALLAIAGGAITAFGGRFFKASTSKDEISLEMTDGKKSVKLRALSDSGNLASDPISGKAVIIATLSSSEKIIPKEIYPVFENVCNMEKLPVNVASKIRLIPSATISGNALLPAIKMKNIKVVCGKEEKNIDALVSFVKCEDFSGYDAVIPHEIMI